MKQLHHKLKYIKFNKNKFNTGLLTLDNETRGIFMGLISISLNENRISKWCSTPSYKELKVSYRQLNTSLKKLKNEGFIDLAFSNKYRFIDLV